MDAMHPEEPKQKHFWFFRLYPMISPVSKLPPKSGPCNRLFLATPPGFLSSGFDPYLYSNYYPCINRLFPLATVLTAFGTPLMSFKSRYNLHERPKRREWEREGFPGLIYCRRAAGSSVSA